MSLRLDAVDVLSKWNAPDDRADRLRGAYLEHLAAHEDGMLKACRDGHVTASAVIVDADRARVLLTLHAKIRMWLQTGGHCEPVDRTLADAALREAREESGIAGLSLLAGGAPVGLDRHHTPCAVHLDVQYVALAPPGATELISEESLDLRWFAFDALPADTDDAVRALVARARETV
ncbi:NUDIX hydrolase [Embleya sp. NBC_00888]|uniref:NUDIX hydrolase n=1 Tax=Embleya sp. NBC_00888 TaxID=2975960 RepID=UPI00386EB168|nr:NUDIX hydrolase [Embleya sp. NBC_00888]